MGRAGPLARRGAWRPLLGALSTRRFYALIFLLLGVDGVLVGLHALHLAASAPADSTLRAALPAVAALQDPRFAVTTDRGYAELWQYLKSFLVGAVMLSAYRRTGAKVFLPLGVLSFYLLVDDALMLHERVGYAVERLLPHLGLAGAVGELALLGGVGALAALAIVAAYRRTAIGHRPTALWLSGLFLALAGFGVGVDAVHALAREATESWRVDLALAVLEDAGEMAMLSALLASAICLSARLPRRTPTRRRPVQRAARALSYSKGTQRQAS